MEEKYPPLSDRIKSSFIDAILIVALMYAFAAILSLATYLIGYASYYWRDYLLCTNHCL